MNPALKYLLGLLFLANCSPENLADKVPERDASAFRDYLARNSLSRQWDGPPMPIESDAIRAAYPGQRFYFAFANPPVPPGAPMPDLLARYQAARSEYAQHSLQLTVSVDEGSQLRPFRSIEDINVGLKKIARDEDAATAAAAIISLLSEGGISPAPISTEEVKAERNGEGWLCRVSQNHGIAATVKFDRDGHCVAASKFLNYVRQVPP